MPFPIDATLGGEPVKILGPVRKKLKDGTTFCSHQEVIVQMGNLILIVEVVDLANIVVTPEEKAYFEAQCNEAYVDVLKIVQAMQKQK